MTEANILDTERLFIHIHTEEEYIDAFKTLTDEALMIKFGFPNHNELEAQKQKVKGGMSTYRTTFCVFQLVEKETAITVGNFVFHNWYPTHQRAELGYAMNGAAFMNRGFMKEAIKAIVHYGFTELGINRMEAIIGPANIASQKLVKRLHFNQEGYMKEHWLVEGKLDDSIIYALLKSEYLNNI